MTEHRIVYVAVVLGAQHKRSNDVKNNIRRKPQNYYGKEKESSKEEESCKEAPLNSSVIRTIEVELILSKEKSPTFVGVFSL
jgi:hypothetical protein